jgi:hypothetical protein
MLVWVRAKNFSWVRAVIPDVSARVSGFRGTDLEQVPVWGRGDGAAWGIKGLVSGRGSRIKIRSSGMGGFVVQMVMISGRLENTGAEWAMSDWVTVSDPVAGVDSSGT